jgi:hypothetical protein
MIRPTDLKRIGALGTLLMVVLAISAISSASASAACNYCWHVGGKELKSGELEEIKGAATSSYVLTGSAFGLIELAITCKKAATSGMLWGGSPGTGEATIKYTECKSNSGLCTPAEPIEAKVKSEIVLYVSGGKKYWGDLLSGEGSYNKIAVVECIGFQAEVRGSTVAEFLNGAKEKSEVGKEAESIKGYLNLAGALSESYTDSVPEERRAELTWEGEVATLQGTSEVTLIHGGAYGIY